MKIPDEIIQQMKEAFARLAAYFSTLKPDDIKPNDPNPLPMLPVPPAPPAAKYLWDTPEDARHSLRLICDEEGLTVDQKNDMSKVVHCESGYKIHAKHDNGTSVDHGICQWNSYWHWERTKEISPDEAENNPEKAVRLMCTYVKQGLIRQWVCYSAGLYKNYSA